MKLEHIALASAPVLAFMLAAQPANASELYVKAAVGQTTDAKAQAGGFSIPVNDGMAYQVAVGVNPKGPLRLEASVTHTDGSIAGFVDTNTTDYGATAFMDFNQDGRIQPYFGGGLGYMTAEAGLGGSTVTGNGLEYHLVGGAALKISDNLMLDASYTYTKAGDLDFGFGTNIDASEGLVLVGARIKLA